MKNEALYDYMNIIDQTPPPGAEGTDQGNGGADQYLSDPDTSNVPVDSRLNPEEENILKEAQGRKEDKKSTDKVPVQEPTKKEKKGFLRKLFGKKKEQ
jgi:penicillin-binding protein 1A